MHRQRRGAQSFHERPTVGQGDLDLATALRQSPCDIQQTAFRARHHVHMVYEQYAAHPVHGDAFPSPTPGARLSSHCQVKSMTARSQARA
jgi:hypothetical protein